MQARVQAPGEEQDRAGSTSGWDIELGARLSGWTTHGEHVGAGQPQGACQDRAGSTSGPDSLGKPEHNWRRRWQWGRGQRGTGTVLARPWMVKGVEKPAELGAPLCK